MNPTHAIPGAARNLLLLLLLAPLPAHAADAPPFIWIEGEDFAPDSFLKKPADQWLQGMGRDLLSGGDALSWGPAVKDAPPPPHILRWDFRVPSDGAWRFWAREFYQGTGSEWRYRFSPKNGATSAWHEADKDNPSYDITSLGPYRAVTWIRYGSQPLTAGNWRLEVEVLGPGGHGRAETYVVVFDAFLLTQGPFLPRGARKPGEAAPTPRTPSPAKADYY